MKVSLRNVDEGDWEFYRSLYMSPETMNFIAKPFAESECQKFFQYYFSEKYKASKNKLFIIVAQNEFDDEIKAGIMQYSFKPKCKFTSEFGIMLCENLTGHGLGKKANKEFFQVMSNINGLKRIYARINIHNQTAQKLYIKLGFRQVISSQRETKMHDLWLADKSVFSA